MIVRPLHAADVLAARALLADARHAYAGRPLEILDAAAVQPGVEYHALVAEDDAGAVVGVVLFGVVAGTVGGGALYGVAVASGARRRGVAHALVERAADALATLGVRLAVAEVPDDPAVADVRALLDAAGFVERSRVPDLVRDGVALAFLVRALGA
ncbi:MAG TPA: GNAT family N-acetyltransferase [Gemmatimonadaceae bacterium]|nr:GNAT family N-acetyltransferase [Gemmatimonadaceae bacterium]